MLDSYRKKLRLIDAEIAKLVAKRLEITARIGEHKIKMKLPLRDLTEEAAAQKAMREQALNLGLQAESLDALLEQILKLSIDQQSQQRTVAGLPPQD
jgi:chorismate mutase